MPASFVASQVQAQAYAEALLVKHGGLASTPASLEAYYHAHIADFDTLLRRRSRARIRPSTRARRRPSPPGRPSPRWPRGLQRRRHERWRRVGCVRSPPRASSPSSANIASLATGRVSAPISQSGPTSCRAGHLADADALRQGTDDRAPDGPGRGRAATRTAVHGDGSGRSAVTVDPRYGVWSAEQADRRRSSPPVPPASSLAERRRHLGLDATGAT